MKTQELTNTQARAIKICIRDHGEHASSAICKAWNTGNWASVTPYADHQVLHQMKNIGVAALIAACR